MTKETINEAIASGKLVSFIPENTDKMALVDYEVLLKLARHLPSVSFETIKKALVKQIDCCTNLSAYIELLKKETNFHMAVNEIRVIDKKENAALYDVAMQMSGKEL